MEEWNETVEKWQELMEKGHYVQLREELNEENPANVAEFLEELPADKQLFLFRLLSKDMAAEASLSWIMILRKCWSHPLRIRKYGTLWIICIWTIPSTFWRKPLPIW